MTVRQWPLFACALLVLLSIASASARAQNQGFTYQGRIDQGAAPAAGPVNLIVRLYALPNGGSPIGTQTINGVPLLNGVFTVTLNGAGEFTANPFAAGADRWVEITVNGTTLTPRQKLTVAPMAAFSAAPWVLNGTTLSYAGGKVAIGGTVADMPLSINDASVGGGGARVAQSAGFQADQATRWHFNLFSPDGSASTNYGLNIVETNVADFRVFLAKGGNVGIGTKTPSGRVEIASANDALVLRPATMAAGSVSRIAFKDPDAGTPTTNLSFKDTGYPNLSVTSATAAPARLGVNTPDPAAPLDVRGEIAFGPTGQFSPVASDSGPIRMLHAVVNSGTGALFSGQGLTVTRNSAGHYTVTFTTPFSNYPSVIVTPITPGTPATCTTNVLNPSSVLVDIFNSAGVGVDQHFSIIVIGAR